MWKKVLNFIFGKKIDKKIINQINTTIRNSKKNKQNSIYLKGSVVTLDGLLGKVLFFYYGKNTVGNNLKKSKDKINDRNIYQNLWEAHKIRNIIAHEPGKSITLKELNNAIDYFKKGFSKLT